MRLMQFKALVLPAPLGPMSAKSSPASTANDTPSSTVRPPKRRSRFSTSSSAIPPPASAVLLDVAIAPALAARLAEIEFLDIGVVGEPRLVAVEDDATVLQNVAVVGHLQRHGGALLHQQDGDAQLAADLHEPRHQILDHDGRKPERQLIQ